MLGKEKLMRIFFDKWLFGFLRLTGPNPGLLHGLDCYKMRVTLRRGGWWRREGGASTECQRRCGQRQRPGAHLNISLQPSSLHHRELRPLSRSPRRLPRCQHFLDLLPTSWLWLGSQLFYFHPGAPAESQCQCQVLRDYELDTQSSLLFSLRFSPASSGLCSGILDSSCNAQSNSLKPISPLIPFVLPLRNTLWWKRLPTEHCLLLTNGVDTVNPIWPRGGRGGGDRSTPFTQPAQTRIPEKNQWVEILIIFVYS